MEKTLELEYIAGLEGGGRGGGEGSLVTASEG